MLSHFVIERRLGVPAATVWSLIDDFGSHDQFNPFIERSRITNDVATGEGAEREITMYDGSVIRQRIVDYQPGKSMVIEAIDGDPLLRRHVVEISVVHDSSSSCMLAYRVSFQMPGGVIGLPIALARRILLRARYRQLLRNITIYCRSDQAK